MAKINFMTEFISKILDNLINKESFGIVLGAFTGAFFAFYFMILAEKYRRYVDRRKKCINEHVYLERYFNHLLNKLEVNESYIKKVQENFKIKVIDVTRFQQLPIRIETEMNLLDLIFLNKYQPFMINLIQLNESITDINYQKERINNFIEKYFIENGNDEQKKFTENSRTNLSAGFDIFVGYISMIKDELYDLYSENRFLLNYYQSFILKKWYIKKRLNFCSCYRKNKIDLCRKEYEQELKQTFEDFSTKYKKYGIIS